MFITKERLQKLAAVGAGGSSVAAIWLLVVSGGLLPATDVPGRNLYNNPDDALMRLTAVAMATGEAEALATIAAVGRELSAQATHSEATSLAQDANTTRVIISDAQFIGETMEDTENTNHREVARQTINSAAGIPNFLRAVMAMNLPFDPETRYTAQILRSGTFVTKGALNASTDTTIMEWHFSSLADVNASNVVVWPHDVIVVFRN